MSRLAIRIIITALHRLHASKSVQRIIYKADEGLACTFNALAPQARVIVLLHEPVQRVYSQYALEVHC